jgi:CheY-like chemotaxis protein
VTIPTKRILIVDDSGFIRAIVKVTLEKTAGWEVLTASSGEEALVQSESLPDAILLDVVMPEMDGPATIRKLQENQRTRSIPVILLTATEQTDDLRALAELGAAALIAKPFDPVSLASQVRAALGWTA